MNEIVVETALDMLVNEIVVETALDMLVNEIVVETALDWLVNEIVVQRMCCSFFEYTMLIGAAVLKRVSQRLGNRELAKGAR